MTYHFHSHLIYKDTKYLWNVYLQYYFTWQWLQFVSLLYLKSGQLYKIVTFTTVGWVYIVALVCIQLYSLICLQILHRILQTIFKIWWSSTINRCWKIMCNIILIFGYIHSWCTPRLCRCYHHRGWEESLWEDSYQCRPCHIRSIEKEEECWLENRKERTSAISITE